MNLFWMKVCSELETEGKHNQIAIGTKRRELNIVTSTLADEVGVDAMAYYNWELGISELSDRKIAKIKQTLSRY